MNNTINLKRKLGEATKQKNNDITTINSFYKKYKDPEGNSQVDENYACMLINLAATSETEESFNIVQDIFNTTTAKSKNEAIYTAMIRAYCGVSRFTDAIECYHDMITAGITPHTRTFAPFFGGDIPGGKFKYIISQIQKYNLTPTTEMFADIFESLPANPTHIYLAGLLDWVSEFNHFVPDRLPEALGKICKNIAAGFNLVTTNGKCTHCKTQLKVIDITNEERHHMISCLELKTPIQKFLEEKTSKCQNFDIIVDGANVAMYNNSEFNWRKVDKVLSQIPVQKRVLVVFHVGRKRQAMLIPQRKNVEYYFSNAKEDDDLTWICATLVMNAFCVTADKMSDHLYHRFSGVITRETFEKWVECHIINYKFTKGDANWLTLTWPATFSTRIQQTSKNFHWNAHIPTLASNGVSPIWYCIDLYGCYSRNDVMNDECNGDVMNHE